MVNDVYNQKGEKAGKITLPSFLFDTEWNAAVVRQVVDSMTSNKRTSKAHAKGRGEVRGGGKKPWRQKGTGSARHGSIRSPIWIGGGVTHGPTKYRNYKKKINKKMKRKAFFAVFSEKLRDKEVLFMDNISFENAKTKEASNMLRDLSNIKGFQYLGKSSLLIISSKKDDKLKRAFSNLKRVNTTLAKDANVLDLLSYKYILIPKESIEVFK